MSATISIFDRPAPAGFRPAQVFESVLIGVNQRGGQTVNRPDTNTLVISRRHATLLIILCCVVLFPIGLLALLGRRTEVITVTTEERDDGVVVSAVGEGDKLIVGALETFLDGS